MLFRYRPSHGPYLLVDRSDDITINAAVTLSRIEVQDALLLVVTKISEPTPTRRWIDAKRTCTNALTLILNYASFERFSGIEKEHYTF